MDADLLFGRCEHGRPVVVLCPKCQQIACDCELPPQPEQPEYEPEDFA